MAKRLSVLATASLEEGMGKIMFTFSGIRKNWWVFGFEETLIQFHSPEVLVGGFNLCTWLKASSISTGPLLSRSGDVSQSRSHFGNLVLNGTFFRCSGTGFRPAPSRFPPAIRPQPQFRLPRLLEYQAADWFARNVQTVYPLPAPRLPIASS